MEIVVVMVHDAFSRKRYNNAFVYDRRSFRFGDNATLPPLEEATLIPESLSEWNIVFALCSVTDRDTSSQDAR